MKVVALHGQKHKGSTYHISKMLIDKLDCAKEEVKEYYVNDISDCIGCFQCIIKGEDNCPHRSQTDDIIQAIEEADVILIDSPNYVMNMSGQLKTFFDHMGYRWMPHRPHPSMKRKIGVAISTTAGMGAIKVTKLIASQMFWWSVGKIYRIPVAVAAMSWNTVSDNIKTKVEKKTTKVAREINRKSGHIKPGIRTKFVFNIIKNMHKGQDYNLVDKNYWKDQGWI